jgi:hypothetical protein
MSAANRSTCRQPFLTGAPVTLAARSVRIARNKDYLN